MVRSPVKPAVHSVAEGTMRNEVIDVGLGGGPLRVAPAASTRRPEQVPARRGELDLLRALVVVGLVFFHTAVLFGAGDFPMKAATESPVATVFIAFGATWGMPLLIPLLTGLVALVPLQVYLGSRRAGDTSSYAAFYARFWDVQPSLNFPFVVGAAPGTGVFEVGHLWFLVCLLAFSLVLLPGVAWLRRPRGMRLVERLAGLLARPGAVFLLAMPLVAVELPLGSEVGRAAWNRYSYALLLAYGYLAAADPRIGEAFQRQRRPALVFALLLFGAGGSLYAAGAAHGDPFTDSDPLSLAFRLVKSLDGWLWVVAILGLARSRFANRSRSAASSASVDRADRATLVRRLGAYANGAVLPFYVLHETVIVVIAYWVLTWRIGAGAQYLLIVLSSLTATLLLYEVGVRRTRVTRLLFGLKPGRVVAARGTGDEHRQ